MGSKKIPKVRIGDMLLPAHKIWGVVETINTAASLVEKFNETNPQLVTPATESVTEKVRTRIHEMEMRYGGEGSLKAAAEAEEAELAAAAAQAGSTEVTSAEDRVLPEAFADAARQLLTAMPLEEAIRMLEEDYGEAINVHELIALVGADVYEEALVREAKEFQANMISPDQIALLWNESGIARPSGGLWTERDIQELTG
jgi:hypothetical protein